MNFNDDKALEFRKMNDAILAYLSPTGEASTLDVLPWLRFVPGLRSKFQQLEADVTELKKATVGKRIEQYKVGV